MQTRRRGAARCVEIVKRLVFVLGRPGNDLLSRVLRHSTIGAEEFNGRVRDGIGFFSSSLKSPDRRRTNRQGCEGAPPQLSSGSKVFLVNLNTPGSQDPARPTGRPCSCMGEPSGLNVRAGV